jgi:pimeloyl-ACP methyl ester carboxylesterase
VPLATGARLEREMPGARLVVLEACGHVPQEERPEESLRIVEAFLDG